MHLQAYSEKEVTETLAPAKGLNRTLFGFALQQHKLATITIFTQLQNII